MDRYMDMMNDIADEMSSTTDRKKTPAMAKKVCIDIGRFFFENGIPLNVARSASFVNMCRSVGNYGQGLEGPTMNELKTWILKSEEKKTTTEIVNEIKSTWKRTGVSLLLDGWSDVNNRSLLNFLVHNQYGTVFLKTVDALDCVKDAQKLFELFDGVIEEIGEDIVVQVITDNTSTYKEAGRLLMEKRTSLYWTPCAAHCIDLMLEKIGELPQHKNALLKSKRVTNFIYNHQRVLDLTRKFVKRDLFRPATSRSATAFLTLDNMHQLKKPLQMMLDSKEWSDCTLAKKDEGRAVKSIIKDDTTFWPSVVYSIKTTKPLVHALRMVVGEKTPTMGYIYGAMNEAKEMIAKNLDGEASFCKEIFDIIDQLWKKQLHHDLHAAAYFLNPRFRWSPDVSEHPEIKIGLYNCMERLFKDDELLVKVDSQIYDFSKKGGMFSHRVDLPSYLTCPPVDWWNCVGDEVPELKSFAMKILGLTCSTSACERNWSGLKQVHTKKRNHESTTRLNSLVYIMYNNRLKHNFLKKQSQKEENDPLIVEDVLSDDEWIANPNDDEEIEDDGKSSIAPTPKKWKRNQGLEKRKEKGKNVQSVVDEDEDEEDDGDFDDHFFFLLLSWN